MTENIVYEELDEKLKRLYLRMLTIKDTHPIAYKVNDRMWPYFEDDGLGFFVEGRSFMEILHADSPILLSAPHAVRQVRKGKIKADDMVTGPLVEYLAESCQVSALIRTRCLSDDPSRDLTGPGMEYKQKLLSMVTEQTRLFIDIHGAEDGRGFDFCLGTNDGKSLNGQEELCERLKAFLSEIGSVKQDVYGYRAASDGCVTRYMAEHRDIPCIQLEIAGRFRMEPEYLSIFTETMEAFLNSI